MGSLDTKKIIGNTIVVDSLTRAAKKNSLLQSHIFYGKSGVGKKKLAFKLAKALLCESDECTENVSACHTCSLSTLTNHPSIYLVDPEQNSIKIETSREIINFLSLQSNYKARIVIIDDFHLMTPQAANALLKVIEEPPDGSYFFLITSNLSLILSTIKSRCQISRFISLTFEDMLNVIPDLTSERFSLSQGSLASALEINDDTSLSERREWYSYFEKIVKDKVEFDWKKNLRDKTSSLEMLVVWQALVRDVLFLKSGGQLINEDLREELDKLSFLPEAKLQQCYLVLREAYDYINSSIDRTLVFDSLNLKLGKPGINYGDIF